MSTSHLRRGWTERVTKASWTAARTSAEAVIEGPGFFPAIKVQRFTDVEFNGRPLKTFDPDESDTQNTSGSTIYAATRIRHGTDFTMRPEKWSGQLGHVRAAEGYDA